MTDKALEAAARAIYDALPNYGMARKPKTDGRYELVRVNDTWEQAPDRHVDCLSQAKAAISAYLSALPGEAGEVMEQIAHKEQIGIWANELTSALSMSDFLREDWSFDDSVDLEKEVAAQLLDIIRSAITHPGLNLVASLQAMQARAEKAEDRAAGWKLQWEQETKAKTEVLSWYTREKARAEKAERERDIASREIRSLLTSFVREHFPDNAGWRPLDDLVGMITQMDNACTVARDYLSRAETAEARVKKMEPIIEAVAHVGVDFGYGPYVLEDKYIEAARTALKGGSNG